MAALLGWLLFFRSCSLRASPSSFCSLLRTTTETFFFLQPALSLSDRFRCAAQNKAEIETEQVAKVARRSLPNRSAARSMGRLLFRAICSSLLSLQLNKIIGVRPSVCLSACASRDAGTCQLARLSARSSAREQIGANDASWMQAHKRK